MVSPTTNRQPWFAIYEQQVAACRDLCLTLYSLNVNYCTSSLVLFYVVFYGVGGIISKNHEESSRKSQDESSRISKLDSKESFRKFPLKFLQYMSIDLSSMIRPELIYCISFGVTWFEKSVFYARFPTLIHIKLSPMDVPYCTVPQYNHLMNFNWSFFSDIITAYQ